MTYRYRAAELDQVVVALGHGHQTHQHEQLDAAAERGRLEAQGADQQVNPLVGGQLPAGRTVIIQIEGGKLDRLEAGDEEGTLLAAHHLFPAEFHVHLRPDAALQQPLVLADEGVGNMHEPIAEVDQLGPVLRAVQAHQHFVNEGLPVALFDARLGLHRFVGPDDRIGQGAVDQAQPGLHRHRVIGGAVFAQQVFQDVGRHVGAHFDLAYQVLADDPTGEELVNLAIQFRHDPLRDWRLTIGDLRFTIYDCQSSIANRQSSIK